MENPKDPVYRQEDGWYFYDESETKRFGPYPTIGVARIHLINYYHSCLKEAADKVEKINKELITHNISCICDSESILPDDAVTEIPNEPKQVDLKAVTIPEIPDIWEDPKRKFQTSSDSTTTNTVVVDPPKKKKELSTNAILVIWAVIITTIITTFLFADFKIKDIFSSNKTKVEVTIKPKEIVSRTEEPVKTKESMPVVCIKDYSHYSTFMNQSEQLLKENNFGISVWETPGANKGDMVGKLKPGECVEKLDQQGNNLFVRVEGNKVGWIHVMDTTPKK